MAYAENQITLEVVSDGEAGSAGSDGTTFTPSVDSSGNISWTNDGGKPNPQTQNITGPQGEQGPKGDTGDVGETGPAGPQGETGPAGNDGDDGISVVSSTPFYKLDTSTPSKPADNTMTPAGWSTTEPTYDAGSDCYISIRSVFDDGTCKWSDVSKSSSYEAAKQAKVVADAAEAAANDLDQSTYGTITYEYDNSGTIETVFKREDGTYYYLDANDNEVELAEADLVYEDGELVTGRQEDGLDSLVAKAAEEAQDASSSADAASDSASNALIQLSELEKVVDVLTWASEHGEYALTDDEEVQNGRYYFARSGSAEPYTYTVVEDPAGNPSSQGWYELTGVDETVNNYIASHLALTNDGLFVQMDNSTYKMQIASDGIYLWKGSNKIASYSGTVTLGDANGLHMVLSSGELGFYEGTSKVAYISTEKLFITSAEITSELRIGNFVWKPRDGRLTLMYSPVS